MLTFLTSVLIRVRLLAFRSSRFILGESTTARSIKCCLGPRAGSDAVENKSGNVRVRAGIVTVEKQ